VTAHGAITQNFTYATTVIQLACNMTQLVASNSILYTEGDDNMLMMGRYDKVMMQHAMSFHPVINISPLKASLIGLYTVLLVYVNMQKVKPSL
jgi:hypothetical protein